MEDVRTTRLLEKLKQLQEENERLREVLKRTESMLFHGVTSREAWEFVYNFLNKKP